ncbi:MAG: hypothetical protein GXN99_00365 [Candidatus Nanohaloarchaeota archaeon]|nr:hypothetical protein [Candidatus Nanohaloarchaeota archaeon]
MMNVLLWLAQNYKFFRENFVINHMKLLMADSPTKYGEDIAVVEGAVSSKKQLSEIKEIRKNAKILVAIGSCAITGAPSNNRNFLDDEEIRYYVKKFKQLEKVVSIKEVVNVDYELMGCPISVESFNTLIKQIIEKGI